MKFLLIVASTFALFSSVNAGACTDADKAALVKHNADFHTDLKSCATGCLGAGSCTSTCLAPKLEVSSACSNCFGDTTACVVKNCFSACTFSPDGASCLSCTQTNCIPACATCSGIDAGTLPHASSFISANAGGACTDADKAALVKHNADFHADLKSCATGCLGGGSCTATCLAPKIEVSAACSSCFGDTTACVAKNCFSTCTFSPDGASCLSCTQTNCIPACATCTGIDAGTLPHASLTRPIILRGTGN